VGVADEDAGDLALAGQKAVERLGIGQGGTPAQQRVQRHPRQIGIDVEIVALVAEPEAGDAEPLDLEARRELGRGALERRGRRRAGPGRIAATR
jgi:hypothetical protein